MLRAGFVPVSFGCPRRLRCTSSGCCLGQPREADASTFHPEDRARAAIDAQLAEAGWVVQSREQMNLGAGVAVREFATESGPADYALFVSRKLFGVIVGTREHTPLSGFDEQAADEFVDYRLPGAGRSCQELYSVQQLSFAGLDRSASGLISTNTRRLCRADQPQSGFQFDELCLGGAQ